jgi:PhzF family phenazine biosynthesis protein
VDVFAPEPFTGNSLPVFLDAPDLPAARLLRVTQELRHFEAVFLWSTADPATWRARVFDLSGELPFAGHPLLGAAAVLQRAGRTASTAPTASTASTASSRTWRIELAGGRVVSLTTELAEHGYHAVLDQGAPRFLGTADQQARVAHAFALHTDQLRDDLPMEVVSTGLRYLIVPVRPGALDRARITTDITDLVHSVGAEYAVLFDESGPEIRHWNNDGVIEDVATGSAAGTIGAYRLRHRLVRGGEEFTLRQGRFTGRPSILRVRATGSPERVDSVLVGGPVAFVGHGTVAVPQR